MTASMTASTTPSRTDLESGLKTTRRSLPGMHPSPAEVLRRSMTEKKMSDVLQKAAI